MRQKQNKNTLTRKERLIHAMWNLRVSYFISNVSGRDSSSVLWVVTRPGNVVTFLSTDDGVLQRK
jgi:hypothetical protein